MFQFSEYESLRQGQDDGDNPGHGHHQPEVTHHHQDTKVVRYSLSPSPLLPCLECSKWLRDNKVPEAESYNAGYEQTTESYGVLKLINKRERGLTRPVNPVKAFMVG